MKKKLLIILFIIIIMMVTLVFLIQHNNNSDGESQGNNTENMEVDVNLLNWKGFPKWASGSSPEGDFGVYISYPSSFPRHSYEFVAQKDPALVLISTTGKDSETFHTLKVEKVEDTFAISKDNIIKRMDDYRNYKYSDFDFIINSQENVTINNMTCCHYKGIHTYKNDGQECEIPFVAYSFYTGQIENYSYFTIIVIDDSINRANMEPLPEGAIEAYAKKMVESVDFREYNLLYGY